VIFDIVCLGTDSEELEFAEKGRKFRYTGSKQINLGMVHSTENGLPFCYRTYPGSVADVSTIRGLISDLKSMGCRSIESVMDRGFYSLDNIKFMIGESTGFTIPMPTKVDAEKKLISESVGRIDSPLTTDVINGSTVRGYETAVRIQDDEMVCCGGDRRDGDIRAVVLQDNSQRSKELDRLYSNLSALEKKLTGMKFEGGEFVH
jgi:transposase